jgi:hypothetical protein
MSTAAVSLYGVQFLCNNYGWFYTRVQKPAARLVQKQINSALFMRIGSKRVKNDSEIEMNKYATLG